MRYLFLLGLSMSVLSCNPTKEILKSNDNDYKFNSAVELYNSGKYHRAMPVIENLMPQYSYTMRGEELYFMYAMSHYNTDDYVLAGYYFKNFTKKYPASAKAEEASFLAALCYVKESPNYSLDQTDTRNAINELQLFMNRYPNSSKKDTSNKIMDQLNLKLDRKEYEKSKLYFKTENYKAASVSIKTNLELFPNSIYREELLFMLVKSNYLLAENSILSKKLERYEETTKSYLIFAKNFPQSKYLRELQGYNNNAALQIKSLKEES